MVYQCLSSDSTKDCYASIINTAHQIGLISDEHSGTGVECTAAPCGSLMAARHVMERFLKERAQCHARPLEHVVEDLITQVEENLRKHKIKLAKSETCARGACAATCGQYAPIIMDLVLQALTPYA
jgi:hypothetical protein